MTVRITIPQVTPGFDFASGSGVVVRIDPDQIAARAGQNPTPSAVRAVLEESYAQDGFDQAVFVTGDGNYLVAVYPLDHELDFTVGDELEVNGIAVEVIALDDETPLSWARVSAHMQQTGSRMVPNNPPVPDKPDRLLGLVATDKGLPGLQATKPGLAGISAGPPSAAEAAEHKLWRERQDLMLLGDTPPLTDFAPYRADPNQIRFQDRTYFGPYDYLPESMMRDIINTSQALGVDPFQALVVAAMESRFAEFLVDADEVTMMRLTGAAQEEGSPRPSFSRFILDRGLYRDEKYVHRYRHGIILDSDYFYDTPIDVLRANRARYESYVETLPENDMPFVCSINFLKQKGVQGYNPLEKKGNRMYGNPNRRFSKDRMERYHEVATILENEAQFMHAFRRFTDA